MATAMISEWIGGRLFRLHMNYIVPQQVCKNASPRSKSYWALRASQGTDRLAWVAKEGSLCYRLVLPTGLAGSPSSPNCTSGHR